MGGNLGPTVIDTKNSNLLPKIQMNGTVNSYQGQPGPQGQSQPVDGQSQKVTEHSGQQGPQGTSTDSNAIQGPPRVPAQTPSTQMHNQGQIQIQSQGLSHPNAKTTTQVNNGTTTTKTNIASPVCHNCKTQTTPLWRRDETGQVLCNACGLFLKLHGRPRPISLKTDTIKSRNRIKQSNSNSQKSSTPNTPKLESKDKKSPKLKKLNYNHNLQNGNHPVQPLHYPSSTPTQFAPGLQRITSPLLLSNTSSISNSRSSNVMQAAGTLENMSGSSDLGPSATFKKFQTNSPISLMSHPTPATTPSSVANVKKENSPIFSTPSSALNYPRPINSPSFGPQYHLTNNSSNNASKTPETLPPIQQLDNVKPNLPHISNLTDINGVSLTNNFPKPHVSQPVMSTTSASIPSNPSQSIASSGASHPSQQGSSVPPPQSNANPIPSQPNNLPNPGDNNSNGHSNGDEVTLLKTRISELELVNDLYRTRIMELEAMEQAARLRENSIRKRLDEVMNENKRQRLE